MQKAILLSLAITLGSAALAQVKPAERSSLMPPAPRYLVPQSAVNTIRNPKAIEDATGGRLGVALVDKDGKLLLGFNRDDRFALCSTFKAPLAAAILAGADGGTLGLEGQIPFSKSDLIDHAPVVGQNIKRGRMTVAELAAAAVEVSDNSAANLLLPMIGGPEGLTRFMRAHGDPVTRLDRNEPTLNENAPGDERDTTSPAAIATVMATFLFRDLTPQSAQTLRGWLNASSTGDKRIKAGLPKGWTSGSKTGSCGTAFNDVALVKSPKGEEYLLAIYLDRPTVDAAAAEAAIAETASAVLSFVDQAQLSGL